MKKIKRLLSFVLTLVILVGMVSVCATPASAYGDIIEHESNDSMSSAWEIYNDCCVYGDIDNYDDIDYYKFTVDSKSKVKIRMEIEEPWNFKDKVVNSSGNVVATGEFFEYVEDIECSVYITNAFLNAGTYYYVVTNSGGESYYQFYLVCEDDNHTHEYDSDCDEICSICGEVRTALVAHNFADATCAVAKTCLDCGKISGSKLGHTYSNNCDKTCNRCNETRSITHSYDSGKVTKKATCKATGVKTYTCTVCKATKTSTIAKSTTHKYKTTTTKATTSKNGKVVKKCTVCGKVASTTTIKYAKTFKLSATTYAYNGKVKTPSVTVKDSAGKTLKKNTDYTVSYASGRKNVGTYKVTVKMKGNYSGTKTLTFSIKPTTKSSATVVAGGTVKIGAKSNKKITYTSSNSKVAKVDSKGTVTGVKAGTATITVKSGTVSQKVTVKITKPSVKITASKSKMYIGTSMTLKATTNPAGAKVTWSVSNKKLAKISSSGKLTALKKGTVTVTAKFKYKGKTYSSKYKVKISVEYPDVSVFISSDVDYTNLYAFSLTNNSNSTVKILSKGYAYCSGDSGDIKSLYTSINGIGGNYKSINVSKGSTVTAVATLDENVFFYSTRPTYLYLYIEYRGETFKLSCSTDRYGINKCHTITWLYD